MKYISCWDNSSIEEMENLINKYKSELLILKDKMMIDFLISEIYKLTIIRNSKINNKSLWDNVRGFNKNE